MKHSLFLQKGMDVAFPSKESILPVIPYRRLIQPIGDSQARAFNGRDLLVKQVGIVNKVVVEVVVLLRVFDFPPLFLQSRWLGRLFGGLEGFIESQSTNREKRQRPYIHCCECTCIGLIALFDIRILVLLLLVTRGAQAGKGLSVQQLSHIDDIGLVAGQGNGQPNRHFLLGKE